jgi:hypothetical protein
MPILLVLCYNGRLVTVVSLTAAKFKLLIFTVSGFALFCSANMFILIIVYDFCLLFTQLSYIIVYLWKFESSVEQLSGPAYNILARTA